MAILAAVSRAASNPGRPTLPDDPGGRSTPRGLSAIIPVSVSSASAAPLLFRSPGRGAMR
jgi:hypothetical protein